MIDILDGIVVITLDNPPVNSLGQVLRERVLRRLDDARANPAARGIVLTGTDRAFSAGADVTEFGTLRQLQEPLMRASAGKPAHAGSGD